MEKIIDYVIEVLDGFAKIWWEVIEKMFWKWLEDYKND